MLALRFRLLARSSLYVWYSTSQRHYSTFKQTTLTDLLTGLVATCLR